MRFSSLVFIRVLRVIRGGKFGEAFLRKLHLDAFEPRTQAFEKPGSWVYFRGCRLLNLDRRELPQAMEPTQPVLLSTRRRIYLLRHGEVSYFDADGRPYRPATVPLNPTGRLQAEAAARELASVPLDRVLTSDLVRSVETAQILIAGRGLAVEIRPELREVQPGRLADLPTEGLEQAFVGAFTGVIGRDTRFLGGETFGALADRVLGCVQEVLADPRWRHLLVVAHGGVNRVVLAHALGLELRGVGVFEQDPACLNILDVDTAGRWLIRLVNFTPYNAVKIGLERTTMERLYLQYRRPAADQEEAP